MKDKRGYTPGYTPPPTEGQKPPKKPPPPAPLTLEQENLKLQNILLRLQIQIAEKELIEES